MSYQPHLHKGGELYHFRTKGSKNGVSNTPGYRAVGKKAVGFLNAAGQYVYNNAAKAAGSAGNWLSDRGKQVSKAATNAYNSVSGKNYRDARAKQSYHAYRKNWASDDLGDPISGYQQNERAKRATSANKKAKNLSAESSKYVQAVRSNRITANESKALGREDAQRVGSRMNANAGRAATAKKNADNAMQKAYNRGAEYRDWVQKGANRMRAHAGQEAKAKREADNSLYGKLDNATKGARNWLSNKGEDISRAANSAGNSISKTAKKAGEALNSARDSAGNWLSDRGEDISRAAKNARTKVFGDPMEYQRQDYKARRYEEESRDPVRALGYASNTKDARPSTWFDKDAGLTGRDYSQQIADKQRVLVGKAAKARQAAKNETVEGKLDNLGKDISNTAKKAKKAVSGAASDAAKNIGDTAKKAGDAISKTASDAKKTASKVVSGAGKAAGRAAKTVGNFASTSFSSAKKAVGSGANRAGEFISGLFGKKKSKSTRKPTRSKK